MSAQANLSQSTWDLRSARTETRSSLLLVGFRFFGMDVASFHLLPIDSVTSTLELFTLRTNVTFHCFAALVGGSSVLFTFLLPAAGVEKNKPHGQEDGR